VDIIIGLFQFLWAILRWLFRFLFGTAKVLLKIAAGLFIINADGIDALVNGRRHHGLGRRSSWWH
jgi:hypothetical protein